MNRVEFFAEQFMPTEPPVYRITDVDFQLWAHEGVKALLLDVEGTIGETGSELLVPEHVGAIAEAREHGIEQVALVTNKMITTTTDRKILQSWQDQVEADLVLTPFSPDQGKPNPMMMYKAMEYFGVGPKESGVVGDKASADMRAGYFAGIKHRAWTRPFGGNQHVGDRLVRAPFESVLRINAHMQLTPKLRDQMQSDEGGQDLAKLLSFIAEDIEPGIADGQDKIVGFGLEDIELSEETLASIKTPAFRTALENIKEMVAIHGEVPAEKLKEFLYEHGRTTATVLTYGRLALAAGLVAVRMSDLDPKTKQAISVAIVGLAAVSDFLDGPAARAHKDGATKKGAAADQNIDKVLTAAVDLFALMPKQAISDFDLAFSNGRDMLITGLRKPFKERGIDTKSEMWGKVATASKLGAQIFGVTLGGRYPEMNHKLQRTATIFKLASMVHAPRVWVEQHELKQHNANNFKNLGKLSLAA